MNPIWTQIIIRTTLKQKSKSSDDKTVDKSGYSDFRLAKGHREFLITTKRHVKNFILITVGTFSSLFGFKEFLLTNHFIDGGATCNS